MGGGSLREKKEKRSELPSGPPRFGASRTKRLGCTWKKKEKKKRKKRRNAADPRIDRWGEKKYYVVSHYTAMKGKKRGKKEGRKEKKKNPILPPWQKEGISLGVRC